MLRILFAIILMAVLGRPASAEIDKIMVMNHNQIDVSPQRLIHLPGVGMGYRDLTDSIMILDDVTLKKVILRDSSSPRSLVALKTAVYVAQGDSVVKLGNDFMASQFIARFDNDKFKLFVASDTSIYALTSGNDFSCVYEIFPDEGTIEPIIGIAAMISKIQQRDGKIMLLCNDYIMSLNKDNTVSPIYWASNITDMVYSLIGLFVAHDDGILWLTGPNTGVRIIKEPVQAIWWDDEDVLYYLNSDNDLIAIVGIQETISN